MAEHTYQVGDTVFVRIFQIRGDGYESTIEKIGRRWATLSGPRGGRFDLETGAVDGGAYSSPGKVYPSHEAFVAHNACLAAWSEFLAIARTMYNPPLHLTHADIQALTAKIATPTTAKGEGE